MRRLRSNQYRSVPGDYWGTPKELWGFRLKTTGDPVAVAEKFLRVHADVLGTRGLRLELQRAKESVGATHVLFQQQLRGYKVHRGYVTVHVSHGGEVYLAKNRAIPRGRWPESWPDFDMDSDQAAQAALEDLGVAAKDMIVRPPDQRWWPERDRLRPVYRFRVLASRPRREWLIFVDATNGEVVERWDNLAQAAARARVFDPNPVAAVASWRELLTRKHHARKPPQTAYRTVTLDGLLPRGRLLDGTRASTHLTGGERVHRSALLEQDATDDGFLEAMAYYHVDRVVAYLESLGYRGRRVIFDGPVPIDAHATWEDSSCYSPDGRSLTFGTGGVDDAEDAEVILHELGHAIQDAICPDFGQTPEAAAMGEGFGDYLAASFFADRKPTALRPYVMSWDAIAAGGDPPYLRRLDGRFTFKSFQDRDEREHENGKIWSATLWDIWNAVGRDVADRIIVESHFQLDAFTKLARGARAIIDADQNLFQGRHATALRRVFHARGIGPVE